MLMVTYLSFDKTTVYGACVPSEGYDYPLSE